VKHYFTILSLNKEFTKEEQRLITLLEEKFVRREKFHLVRRQARLNHLGRITNIDRGKVLSTQEIIYKFTFETDSAY